MAYTREDKSKGIEEGYVPDWTLQIKPVEPIINEIPGLNAPQLNQDISIEI